MQGVENGEACDPSFLFVFGKRECAACWFQIERRVVLFYQMVVIPEGCNMNETVVFCMVAHLVTRRDWLVVPQQVREMFWTKK